MSLFPNTIAVIPAAGISQRPGSTLRAPQSDAMVPVAGKPAIFRTIQELLRVGIRREIAGSMEPCTSSHA